MSEAVQALKNQFWRINSEEEKLARNLEGFSKEDLENLERWRIKKFEEFDPSSERTVTACLLHASRADSGGNFAVSGERVINI